MGGPTFGIDVKGEEILRFDPHGSRGHWHKGGYDRLGAGGSHQDFPEGIVESEAQLTWALAHLEKEAPSLLEEAGYSEAAAAIDAEMFQTAIHDLVAHLEQEGDLRSVAIERELINA
jgi:hypothetical protein